MGLPGCGGSHGADVVAVVEADKGMGSCGLAAQRAGVHPGLLGGELSGALFLLGFSGLIFTYVTWNPSPPAELGDLLKTMVFLSLMVTPILTMNTLAQERASGTIELLMTRPVRDSEVVLGKFLAVTVLYLAIISVTLVYALFLGVYGDPDWGPVMSGYLGLVLAGISFLALGVLASSLVASQVAAAVIGYVFLLLVWLIGWIHLFTKGTVAEVTRHISVFEHVMKMTDGTIDSRSIIFLLSITVFALFMAIRVVENRRTI